jgi:hypothetical protein
MAAIVARHRLRRPGPLGRPCENQPVTRFYGIDEANALLTELRPMLEDLRQDRDAVAEAQHELVQLRTTNGSAEHAQELARRQSEIRDIVQRMKRTVTQLEAWSVTLRDIGTGLVDFPALANGRPIWLCWRLGEEALGWWHETDAGFDQRRPLLELS